MCQIKKGGGNKLGKDIRILLVDDHQVVRDGLRNMLAEEADMEVVGQSAGGEEALTLVAEHAPNIILMDIKMPRMNGIKLAYLVKQKSPDCGIIMLSLYDEYLTQAMGAGARGYLLKDISRDELIQAIRQVHRGEVVISKDIAARPQTDYERRAEETKESLLLQSDSPSTMLEEVQLVIPPLVDASQVIRFTTQVEERLQTRILQIVGSWREGTAVTAILPKAIPLAEILSKLREIAGIDTVEKAPPKWENSLGLIKKALAIPSTKSQPRKTIFINLKNERGEPVISVPIGSEKC